MSAIQLTPHDAQAVVSKSTTVLGGTRLRHIAHLVSQERSPYTTLDGTAPLASDQLKIREGEFVFSDLGVYRSEPLSVVTSNVNTVTFESKPGERQEAKRARWMNQVQIEGVADYNIEYNNDMPVSRQLNVIEGGARGILHTGTEVIPCRSLVALRLPDGKTSGSSQRRVLQTVKFDPVVDGLPSTLGSFEWYMRTDEFKNACIGFMSMGMGLTGDTANTMADFVQYHETLFNTVIGPSLEHLYKHLHRAGTLDADGKTSDVAPDLGVKYDETKSAQFLTGDRELIPRIFLEKILPFIFMVSREMQSNVVGIAAEEAVPGQQFDCVLHVAPRPF